MLTQEENELLCRVGPGTPMGAYMRAFWLPALRGERLAAGGAPVRLRLLGEDLVAFRAADGRVGIFDEACPHRGASLAMACNEGDGLRCSYHGLKLSAGGTVVDVPMERRERRARYAAQVPVAVHPVHEAGGIVWTWLGDRAVPPAPFPEFNWTRLPAEQVKSAVGIIPANWMQGLEGQLDSAHVGILHRDQFSPNRLRGAGKVGYDSAPRLAITTADSAPSFEFEPQPYGYREAAVRVLRDGRHYVRVREFVVPFYSFIPLGGRDDIHNVTMSVPIDDSHSAQWDIFFYLNRALPEGNVFDTPTPDDYAANLGTLDNRFGQDRRRMRESSFSGLEWLRVEDFAVAVSQGAIVDRSREYLGSSDTSVLRARRLLIAQARQHATGKPALGVGRAIDWSVIRALDAIIPADGDWRSLPR